MISKIFYTDYIYPLALYSKISDNMGYGFNIKQESLFTIIVKRKEEKYDNRNRCKS